MTMPDNNSKDPVNITAEEQFKSTLEKLGFANHKPSQMTNSDYWLCTCTAMREYAQPYINRVSELEAELDNSIKTLRGVDEQLQAEKERGAKLAQDLTKGDKLFHKNNL